MKIGILTSGGDCPGINATIRSAGKCAIKNYSMGVIGIENGFLGMIEKQFRNLDEKDLSGILNIGGTILGTSREKPFKKMILEDETSDKPGLIYKNYKSLDLDALICIGGNGTQKTAHKLTDMGINVIGIPKTIDNDVFGTDICFGFNTAVAIATDAIDRLNSTASSHKRVMVIEVMGHKAGWIALHAGMAGGGDVILLPELGYDIERVNEVIIERSVNSKPFSIVVVAEGVRAGGKKHPAQYIAQEIEWETGIETRDTVLGYVQRGGTPTPYDRILGTRMGACAVELIAQGRFNTMVAVKGNNLEGIDLAEVAGKTSLVDPEDSLIVYGRQMGINFGF